MGLRLARRNVFLKDDEQDLYAGLPLEDGRWPERRPPRAVSILDDWFEEPLEADWVVAYRLGLQEQDTRVVVSEIRIFPAAPPRQPESGRWVADALGSRAPVPVGGLKARTVRRVRLRAFERELSKIFKAYRLPLAFRAPEQPPGGAKRGRKVNEQTGMRKGEILSLQWSQIEGIKIEKSKVSWTPKAEIVLPWAKTKTRRDRRIPISTRLKAILEMRRLDPAGAPHALDAFVFGTEIGTRLLGVGRAWHTAVLKSHGHTPEYTETANLAPESRAALSEIDLHFHDLRREAGSRWLDGGVPLHTIRDWLGHTNIAQTSTYLAGTATTQHDAMTRFEEHQAALQPSCNEGRQRGAKAAAVGRSASIM
jgi:integrase